MPVFDADVSSEQVVTAFASHVKGRVFVITGASNPSIGSSIATALAKASPARILIASRNAAKVEPVLSAIRQIDQSIKTTFVPIDLSDHDSVRRAATEILSATRSKIDVLINSAGIMALRKYTLDKQGIEMQLSVNHVGHFLLTNLLMSAFQRGSRIVNITSVGYQISPVHFDDCSFSGGESYDHWTGYGQAKTAQILFTYGLTKRLKHRGIESFACHPGSNLDTKLGSHLVMEDYADIMPITKCNTGKEFTFVVGDEPRFKTYEQIGATPLIAALDPDLATKATQAHSLYLQNGRVMKPLADHAYDSEDVERCWKLSERLVGQEFMYEI